MPFASWSVSPIRSSFLRVPPLCVCFSACSCAGRPLPLRLFVFRKIQRSRGAGARLWLVEALCVSRTHRTTRKSCPAFLANCGLSAFSQNAIKRNQDAHRPDEAPVGLLSRARERAPHDRAPRARERHEQPHTRVPRTNPRPAARARRRRLLPLPPARRPQQPELVARRLDQGRFSVVACSTRPRPRACATVLPTQLAQNTAAANNKKRRVARR